MFDLLNDILGPLYKANLKNRTYARGASRKDKTLEEFRSNRKLKGAYIE